jgi:hypothetical protein
MRGFFEGFEKQASASKFKRFVSDPVSRALNWGKGLGEQGAKGYHGFMSKNVGITTTRGVEEAANIVVKKIKPILNKLQSEGVPLKPSLENLSSFKKGILPALAVGAGFETGRQGIKALSKYPEFSRQQREKYKKRKK